jgi:hypothetical protein
MSYNQQLSQSIIHQQRHKTLFPSVKTETYHPIILVKKDILDWIRNNKDAMIRGSASGPVAIDTVVESSHSGNATSLAKTITVATGNSNLAIVAITILSNSGAVSSVTGAANAFNKIVEWTGPAQTGRTISVWISLAPATGSNTITSNFPTAGSQTLGLYSLYNVDQTTGFYSNSQTNQGASGTTPTINITPKSLYSMCIDCATALGSLSAGNKTQGWIDNALSNDQSASQYVISLANLNQLTFTWSVTSAAWSNVVVEIKASAQPVAVSDTPSITESVSKKITKAVSDTILTSDSTQQVKSGADQVSDSPTVSETVSKKVGKAVSDTVVSDDSVSVSLGKKVSVSDSVVIDDSVTTTTKRTVSVSDTVTTDDSVSKQLGKVVFDNVTITEVIKVPQRVNISDQISTTETVSKKVGKSVSDTVSTTDTVSEQATIHKFLTAKYNVYAFVNKTSTVKYQILNYVVKDLNAVYTIFNTINNIMTAEYQIYNNVIKTITSKYNIFENVIKTITAEYSIRNLIHKRLTAKYTVHSVYQIVFHFRSHIVRALSGTSHVVRVKSFISKIKRVITFNSYRDGR